ncbi:MAG TPA: hypothetical protein VF273_07665 [Pelobium sp.]
MTDILVNSLVMAGVAACILIPVFIVKKINRKKKQALIQSKLDEIALSQQVKFIRTETIGNLLLAYSESNKLLLLNSADFTHEIITLENVVNVQEYIDYNGKEVKNILVRLSLNGGKNKDIQLYKQYDSSERELSKAKKLAAELTSLLSTSN